MAAGDESLKVALAGRYEVERPLGHGGMATVYLAQDLRHRRPVALKVLRPELAAAIGPERFLREIEIAAQLSHPHILPVHDSGEAAGLLFYVMPYVEGESLRERLRHQKQLPIDEAIQVAREVADALGHAHRHGVVHRDIKPENILLDARGRVKIADFGLASRLPREQRPPQPPALIEGSLPYLAPEQTGRTNRSIDERTDLYSLGVVGYFAFSATLPFEAAKATDVLAKQVTEPAPPPHGPGSEPPEDLKLG